MINSVRLLIAAGALLIGSVALATPAQAYDSTSCYDGLDGKPVCSTTWAPAPPPPDSMRPAPLPAPGLDNAPCEALSCQAPAPVYQAPVAPQPVYIAPAAPAPVYVAPVPAYVQPAAPAYGVPAAPAAVDGEAVVAPESVQEVVEAATTPTVAATPSAAPVAATGGRSVLKPVQDIEYSGTIVASDQVSTNDAVDSTPVVLFVNLVAGAVALVVILHFGPGIAGIRGMVRTILRR
jgi:hypothetical protein